MFNWTRKTKFLEFENPAFEKLPVQKSLLVTRSQFFGELEEQNMPVFGNLILIGFETWNPNRIFVKFSDILIRFQI
jgi:hypothetical protein